ncbi:AraC family transcriptional regulator [Paenibacillus hexagrammi]|uniref:AraC family transcriptional regulator n=1 Tax=Paenibacillus hexagrammi TaxID=2908839 RepID=A0ABY3SCZ9_9BACL|nr:helix-turn-helix domain-containing protein [Paenibacillus sp. YPD9-1]UJF31280.1 AraC family transcriptional regulator [Paenibacillus sp. YPD9-1]
MHKRLLLTPSADQPYPLFIESIGHHEDQEKIIRDEGYPYYHWLQTYSGEGELWTGGKCYRLSSCCGFLLPPSAQHAYSGITDVWCTQYITFGGPLAEAILHRLGLHDASMYRWESSTTLATSIMRILAKAETGNEYTGYDASADLYAFLMALKKHGQVNNRASISKQIMYLQPLLDFLEHHFADPDLGLTRMAEVLGITPRHMNTLFHHAFDLSPYTYLILLRLRKSKELLLSSPQITVKHVAEQSGFRDASHYVSSFRRHVGLTPEKFRQLN